MEHKASLDIFELGKDTFNFHYNSLRDTKKNLKNYLTIMEIFTNSLKDHKKSLKGVYKEVRKYAAIDKPFNFVKKFDILFNFHYNYNKSFLEIVENNFENLKKSINDLMNKISDYLAYSQKLAMNIKTTSESYFTKYDKLIEALEETEITIIEEYTKKTYRICLNKQKNKDKDKNKIVKETLVLERDYLNSEEEIKEKANTYIDEFNSKMKSLRPKLIQLNEDSKNGIIDIIKSILNKYSNAGIADIENKNMNNVDDNETFKKEIGEYLNYTIKKDNNCEILKIINLEKYMIKIAKEEEKNSLEIENFNAIPQNMKLTKNLIYTSKDVYNIINIFYECNFKTINKSLYDLEKEKNKLKISTFMGRLLNYNFDTHEIGKEKPLTEEDKKKYTNLILTNEDYIIKFLLCLNNYRTTGRYEITEEVFNTVKHIFNKIADNLLLKKNKRISSILIILSQTFYIMKDFNKYYLQKEIKNHKFFRTVEFWQEHINNSILEEIDRFEKGLIKNDISFSEEKKKKKVDDIIFTKMISLIASFNGFEIEKEKIDQILTPIMDKYQMKDDVRKSVFSIIESKK